ncbi:MAG: MBL fold metallo-hydrolase [Acidobacteriota bacterium]
MQIQVRTLLLFILIASGAVLAAPPQNRLDIYFIDVEGGAATLIVTPLGQSVLIDCGWKEADQRDAKRILHVASKLANLTKLDYFVSTHFHTDHFGSLSQLTRMIPITHYLDHARMKEDQEYDKNLYPEYLRLSESKRRVLKAGDVIPLQSGATPLKLSCVVSDGIPISHPVGKGHGPNPCCNSVALKEPDPSDNAKSIGLLLSFGNFEFLNLGDLTWNVEHSLVCPENRIGIVDLLMVTHHGMNISNNPALVRAIHPKVTVMCNGPRKGGHPEVVSLLKSLAGLEAAYQLHRNVTTSEEENTSRELIANWDENCQGRYIKASVSPVGDSYQISIGPDGSARAFSVQ